MPKQKIIPGMKETKDIENCIGVLDAVSKSTLQAMVIVDKGYRIVYFNDIYAKFIFSIQKKRIKLYDLLIDYVAANGRDVLEKSIKKAFLGQTIKNEKEFQLKDGESEWYSIRHTPIIIDDEINYVCIAMLDLTRVRNLEDSLRENKNNLNETQHLGKLAAFKIEYPYGESSWSRETLSILGIDFFNNPVNIYEFLHFVHPADKDKLISRIEDSIVNKDKFQVVFRFMKDENIKYLQLTGNMTHHGPSGKNYLTGSIMDITDSKKAEEKVRNILLENEMLLKEIQHRVKNNFQVMLSLLSLQARHIKDKDFHEIFKVSQNRIKTLALVYEKLYYSKELSKIDFGEYVNQLVKNLIYVYNVNTINVSIKINAENVPMDLDKAVPCGLLINELVSNCLKHAFPEKKRGEISVVIKEKDNNVELIVSDNGVGLPDNIDYKSTETLGLQLVMTLVAQIDGLINYDKNNGSRFTITFPFSGSDRIENHEAIT
jgi:two-component sensor histidine kinase